MASKQLTKPQVGKGATAGTTALAKKEQDSKALLAAMTADAGSGFEEAGQSAFALPFLKVLQDLNPQVKKKMSGYVEGAKPGMIYNTVTKELFTTVRVIPCHFSQVFIEWIPRDKDGGLVGIHPASTPLAAQTVRDERNKAVLPNGNLLDDTRQHFVLLCREDGTTTGCLLSMTATQLKHSRRWMSTMKQATVEGADGAMLPAPMWAYSYELGSEEEANEQGSWYSWKVQAQEPVSNLVLYRTAKAFGQSMRQQKPADLAAQHARERVANAPDDAEDDGRSDAPADLDNDIDP